MKDGFNKRINSENAKKIVTTPATAIPEILPEKVTLAPLPLFNTAAISKSPPETPLKGMLHSNLNIRKNNFAVN